MSVLEVIKRHHAVRQFSTDPVPDDVMLAILDAGRRSQSSKNTQPWQFVVVTDRARLEAMSKMGNFAGHLAGASFAVLLVGLQEHNWNSFDLGQAASYLQLAADELGVGSCIAAIYYPEQVKELLNIPADRSAFCAISFGYPAPEHRPAQMGGRKPVEEVAYWNAWEGERS
ncbi:MAG: nitroreductase family protein [Chloroflexi bacterium]|nr:nitroreductase family protein [Chloroflexota bacterium]MCC6891367.1 nitroreductase family protein [Anaerolineae bacterium]